MAEITMYTGRFCGFCTAAKRLLEQKGAAFEEIDVSFSFKARAAMMERANGKRSVPQIFVGDTHIGGCDELYALEQAGDLDPLLQS